MPCRVCLYLCVSVVEGEGNTRWVVRPVHLFLCLLGIGLVLKAHQLQHQQQEEEVFLKVVVLIGGCHPEVVIVVTSVLSIPRR